MCFVQDDSVPINLEEFADQKAKLLREPLSRTVFLGKFFDFLNVGVGRADVIIRGQSIFIVSMRNLRYEYSQNAWTNTIWLRERTPAFTSCPAR